MLSLYEVKLHQQILEEQCAKTTSINPSSRSRKILNQVRQSLGKRLIRIGDSMQKTVW